MALVQEMAVKIDQGFLGAIISLFTAATDPRAEKQKVIGLTAVKNRLCVKCCLLW